jgi:hypothetical protein
MSYNDVIDVLDETKKILTEKGWTQGTYARDAEGKPTDYAEPTACSFCLRGALVLACASRSGVDDVRDRATRPLHKALGRVLTGEDYTDYLNGDIDIVVFNDAHGRTKEDIFNLIDIAKRLEKEAAQ